MPIEPFDVTDENGVRVTGTAEAYRDPKGPYYDPSSEFYQNPRYSDRDINYLNTRDVCRINQTGLSKAVQEAFPTALVKFGIPKPSDPAIRDHINDSIAETLRQCALHPDKYVSNEPPSSASSEAEKPIGDLPRSPPGSGAQQLNSALTLPTMAFPLAALLSPDRARALNDWASAAGRPVADAAPQQPR